MFEITTLVSLIIYLLYSLSLSLTDVQLSATTRLRISSTKLPQRTSQVADRHLVVSGSALNI